MRIVTLIITLLLAIATTMATQLFKPLFAAEGTSVITAKENGTTTGGKKYTVKLPTDLSIAQVTILNFAYDVAKKDGIKNPEYLQGLLMQESRAGGVASFRVAGHTLGNKPDDLYFGIGQIKLKAAQDVMKAYPELWSYLQTKTDHELQARLILDDQFNVRVASKYLLLMGVNNDSNLGITAYNVGAGGVKLVDAGSHDYTERVKRYAASSAFKQLRGTP